MIGIKIGKVIVFAIRLKRCVICEVAIRVGRIVRVYDCRCNWDGSFKVMEEDVCIEFVKVCGEFYKV